MFFFGAGSCCRLATIFAMPGTSVIVWFLKSWPCRPGTLRVLHRKRRATLMLLAIKSKTLKTAGGGAYLPPPPTTHVSWDLAAFLRMGPCRGKPDDRVRRNRSISRPQTPSSHARVASGMRRSVDSRRAASNASDRVFKARTHNLNGGKTPFC